MKKNILLLVVSCCIPLLVGWGSGYDESTDVEADSVETGTTLPSTCTVGELFIDTDADSTGTLYFCRATDSWKDVDDDGDTGGGGDLLADGTVGLSTNWDAGNYEIRSSTFESDVTTGTAPFTVASTTEVANLKAATASALAANPSDCAANEVATAINAAGDLTCSALTDDYIPDTASIDLAATLTVTDNENTNENNAILFTSGGDLDGGDLGIESDGTLYYNPSTGIVTTTGFTGALTGNATTATALAANPTNCSSGWAAEGVDASGAVEGCTNYEEDLYNSAGLLAALNDETGTGVAVFGTTPTIATPTLSGAINFAGGTVNDDDCTGQLGSMWFDDTDGAFEWCNANSGAPTVLGGGGGGASVEDAAYDAGWNGDNSNAPSQNALHDYLVQLDSDYDADIEQSSVDGMGAGESATPSITLYDSDAAGADDADEEAGYINANQTTTTEDAEVSTLDLNVMVGGTRTSYVQLDGANTRVEVSQDLAVAGSITGKGSWGADITGNVGLNTTALHGVMYQATADATVTLDAAADAGFGATVMFRVRDTSETLIIEVDNADKINLHGTALDAGDTIDSPGSAGDFIVLVASTDADGSGTNGWLTLGYGGAVWTDGGAS